MFFDELEELKRDPKNGTVGIDKLMAVARMKGETAFCGACSLVVAFVRV
jgi:hypothetical protein